MSDAVSMRSDEGVGRAIVREMGLDEKSVLALDLHMEPGKPETLHVRFLLKGETKAAVARAFANTDDTESAIKRLSEDPPLPV